MEVATAMEMAAKNAHDLQVQEPKQVHKVTIRNEECYRCGESHNATDCKWKDAKCYVCDKKGHLAKNAEIKGSKMLKKNRNLKQTQQGKTLSSVRLKHILLKRIVTIWRIPPTMYQLEGASVSVISCKQVFGSDNSLEKSTYTGEKIDVLGKRKVTVIYNSQSVDLSITVEPEKDKELQDLLRKYPQVFKEGLGTLKGTKARIYVDKDATPKYFKARPVPYALKEKIEKELDRLEKGGNIEKVEFSEWAALIENRTNHGGQAFSKLDLSQAYQQIVLDEESRKYVTINTHKGLYQYNRLPFGVSSAPGIFQRTMENLLQGIPRVVVRVDDILITGSSKSEHLNNLETVLGKIQESGMRLNKDKCVFLAPEVVYLGHRIDQYGIYPVESKVKAHRGTGT
ncbi:unnamed protein product [Mytilus coruscus]|uniref:Reverse transcriptase domain-containing protein n=1 Tax=Mytilus coruscus TaxID=42192 RepID=A0A6J8B840_MYTCO|nr:unnamed protein product [Mytilus coruscus]